MTVRALTTLIAEGGVQDLRGQVTLVGVEPQSWTVPSFPNQVVPTFFSLLEDDDRGEPQLVTGSPTHFQVSVIDPGGSTIFLFNQEASAPPQVNHKFRRRAQVLYAIPLQVETPGVYRIELKVTMPTVEEALVTSREFLIEASSSREAMQVA